jgi:hypothetical protein
MAATGRRDVPLASATVPYDFIICFEDLIPDAELQTQTGHIVSLTTILHGSRVAQL